MIDKIIITLSDTEGFFWVNIGGIEMIHANGKKEVMYSLGLALDKLMYVPKGIHDTTKVYTYGEYLKKKRDKNKGAKDKQNDISEKELDSI
jgi:hypothetical protein